MQESGKMQKSKVIKMWEKQKKKRCENTKFQKINRVYEILHINCRFTSVIVLIANQTIRNKYDWLKTSKKDKCVIRQYKGNEKREM